MFTFREQTTGGLLNGRTSWTSSNMKWMVIVKFYPTRFTNDTVERFGGEIEVWSMKEGQLDRMHTNMDKLPKYIQTAVENAQQALKERVDVLNEQIQAENEKAATDAPQPPKSISENCMTCDNRLYAREIMEYTGKFQEVAFIQDDGSKEMEYEYLYKCCRCGSLVWVPEQMAREQARPPT